MIQPFRSISHLTYNSLSYIRHQQFNRCARIQYQNLIRVAGANQLLNVLQTHKYFNTMSVDDKCDVSDTETYVHSNDDGDGDCSTDTAELSFSQDTDSTVSDTSEDFQASLDVDCAESIKSVEGSVEGSQKAFLCAEYPLRNNTEKALTSFERFIFPEWPKQTAECSDEALEVLRLQLLYGGGFCADMKLIDLSTPENVRFDIQGVLSHFKEKMRHSAINSVEKFVLPNVKQFTTGDIVENLLGDFCGAFCGENITIKEVVLRCDEIPSEFTAGDLKWVDRFLSHYNLDKVTVRNFMQF